MKRFAVALVGFCAAVFALSSHALSFSTFVSSSDLDAAVGQHQTIGFAYAGDRFVGSVYFGGNNNQLYQTGLTGSPATTFGAPIVAIGPGGVSQTFNGEIYVTSSLGIGSFGVSRDIFAGSQSFGSVERLTHDGSSQSTFVTGLVGGVRSIAFDPYGLYGFNMIVATFSGNVYIVNSLGVATLLANTGEDTEGLSFAPQATGPIPFGGLVVASEGSGSLRYIAPDGTIHFIATVPSAEMVSFVPLNLGTSGNPVEGFYAANFPVNVIKAPASDFSAFLGDIVVTGETTHDVARVHWTGSAFDVTSIGTFPNQPEDGIFVTADIIDPCRINPQACQVPEPATLPMVWLALAGLFALRLRKR